MQLNAPNLLTLLRIILIPVFIASFYLPFEGARTVSAVIFAVAAMTDWLDGYLARRWAQQTAFGAFLDPVADKLIVASALILLLQADPSIWLMLPTLIIIGREITISALREWMASLGKRTSVAVSMIGKLKTAAQMGAITFMIFAGNVLDIPFYDLGFILLYVAAILTFWSMLVYLKAAWPILMAKE